jgi:hypothetical protein
MRLQERGPGAGLLQHCRHVAQAGGRRAVTPGDGLASGDARGADLADVNIAIGNLVNLVRQQTAAFSRWSEPGRAIASGAAIVARAYKG